MIIAILAWSGAALSCLLTIPQAVRTLRTDRLDAISATTYWIVLGNAVIWAAWSLLTQQYAAGVPALVNGPAAVLILLRLHRTNPAARHDRPGPRADVAASPAAGIGIALAPPQRVRERRLAWAHHSRCAPQQRRVSSPCTPCSTGTLSRAIAAKAHSSLHCATTSQP
jgi:uncharacterized protein with PQ loop repeat